MPYHLSDALNACERTGWLNVCTPELCKALYRQQRATGNLAGYLPAQSPSDTGGAVFRSYQSGAGQGHAC